MYVFLTNKMEKSMKKRRSADFCADQIDAITNFAVITNVFIKRVHCIKVHSSLLSQYFHGASQIIKIAAPCGIGNGIEG